MSQQYPPGGPPQGYPHQSHPQNSPQPPYGPPPPYGAPGRGGGASVGCIIVGVIAGIMFLAVLAVGGLLLHEANRHTGPTRCTPGDPLCTDISEPAKPDPLARERAALLANPNAYLETSDLINYDKGIINDYRQLVGVTVLNRSHFPVRNMRGDVEWVDDSGARVASMPFTLKGSIAAGDTKKFSQSDGTLSNGTVQSGAKRLRVNFTHIDIVE